MSNSSNDDSNFSNDDSNFSYDDSNFSNDDSNFSNDDSNFSNDGPIVHHDGPIFRQDGHDHAPKAPMGGGPGGRRGGLRLRPACSFAQSFFPGGVVVFGIL